MHKTQKYGLKFFFVLYITIHIAKSEVGVFNVALNKKTDQITTLISSEKAVDGFKTPYGNCASTARGDHNWWAVDLNNTYQITEVRVTNRKEICCAHWLYNFAIYGSSVSYKLSEANDLQLCGHQVQAFPAGTTKIFPCTMDKRFIIINKTKTDNNIRETDMHLCEVEVIAKCPGGKYGENCQTDCSTNCLIPKSCDRFNGNCKNGQCKAGYMGEKCFIECPSGKYGENCFQDCPSNCLIRDACDRINGYCKNGQCNAGYEGVKCLTTCSEGKYGENCLQDCSSNCAITSTCDIKDGKCRNGKCKPGYWGAHCLTECANGTYGDRCNFNCSQNCVHSCDKHTDIGLCIRGKCKPGFVYGGNCTTACSNNTYGSNCKLKCSTNCLDNVCHTASGHCTKGCVTGYDGNDCSIVINASSAVGGIVGGLIVLLLIIVAIVLIFLWLKRKQNVKGHTGVKEMHHYENSDILAHAHVHDQETKYPKHFKVKNNDVDTNVENRNTSIDISDIGKYIIQQKKQVDPFKEEYKRLHNAVYPWKEATLPELKNKNRYKNIYPYDNNRVQLQMNANDHEDISTYINASYIQDYNGVVSYIAAQGPSAHTVKDFWRMIWEQNVRLVVMLSNVIEDGQIMCELYWPNHTPLNYNGINIVLESEIAYPSYIIRTIRVSKGKVTRKIVHYQFIMWDENSSPQDTQTLKKLRDVIEYNRQQTNGLVLIHCSDGVGRTGTMIALDILLDQAAQESQIDIFKCVETLRVKRTTIVRTLIQYISIYDAMNEYLSVGTTRIPLTNLEPILKILSGENLKTLNAQFQFLDMIKPQYATINDTPLESSSRHLDAIFVQGYKKKITYILTKVPLEQSAGDFWQMLWKLRCKTIVCLETELHYQPLIRQNKENLNTATGQWYSDSISSLSFGKLTVSTNNKEIDDNITRYDITIGKNAEQSKVPVRMFSVNGWTSIKDSALLAELKDKIPEQNSVNEYCTVICSDGATECGEFVAAVWLMEMANTEQEVDVFSVVRQIRKSSPQFIHSLDQYKFLHRIIQEKIMNDTRVTSEGKQEYEDITRPDMVYENMDLSM